MNASQRRKYIRSVMKEAMDSFRALAVTEQEKHLADLTEENLKLCQKVDDLNKRLFDATIETFH